MNAREACAKMAAIESEIRSPCCHAFMTWWSAEGFPMHVMNAHYGRCTNCHSRIDVDEFDWKDANGHI